MFGIFGVDLLFKLNQTKTGQKQILNSSQIKKNELGVLLSTTK